MSKTLLVRNKKYCNRCNHTRSGASTCYFAELKFFGLSAIFGTLLGCAVAILNFALMGIILERCVSKQKGASGLMGVGYIGRLALIALAVIWATKVDYLNYVCVIIPLIFPQISIFILNLTRKKEREVSEDERT